VLRRLWEYRESSPLYQTAENRETAKKRFFDLLARIEGEGAIPRTYAIDRFKRDETLDELVAAIERDIGANKPIAALDRLHTYCMKKFAHLLGARRADVTGAGAWEPPWRGIGIARILKKLQLTLAKAVIR
jgi:hypothetical protein